MPYTSFKTRKALGRRYGTDPALLLEIERLNREYALAPGREARGMQAAQFERTQGFNEEQAALNRGEREEARGDAATSGMIGTAANIATTAMTVNAIKGQPLLSNPFSTTPSAAPAEVSMTTQTPTQIQTTYNVNPALMGMETAGAGTLNTGAVAGAGMEGMAGTGTAATTAAPAAAAPTAATGTAETVGGATLGQGAVALAWLEFMPKLITGDMSTKGWVTGIVEGVGKVGGDIIENFQSGFLDEIGGFFDSIF